MFTLWPSALPLLMLLAGCGPELEVTPACTETMPGWEFARAPRCGTIAHNVALAQRLLGGRWPENVRVRVAGEQQLPSGSFGNFDVRWGITLGCDGRSLVHEVLHQLEVERGVFTSFMHPGWATNGNDALDEQFELEAWPLRCSDE